MEHAIIQLSELLEKNHKAEIGYKNAARKIENHALKKFLNGNFKQRSNFSQEIRDTIVKLKKGETARENLPAPPRSLWFNLEPALERNSNKAILAACESGERAALEDYNRLLKDANMPEYALKVIKKQHDLILSDLSKLEDLQSGTF